MSVSSSPLKKFSFSLIALISTMTVLRIHYQQMSFLKVAVILLLIVYLLTFNNKIDIEYINPWYLLSFGSMCISLISAVFFPIGLSWKSAAEYQMIWLTVYTLFYFGISSVNQDEIFAFFKWFRIGLIIQILWAYVQYLCFNLLQFDINQQVFSDLLHTVDQASFFKNEVFGVSGLAYHPSNLAPIIVISYWFSKSWMMRVILIPVAIVSNNATVILALTLCFLISCIDLLIRAQGRFSSRKIVVYGCIALVLVVVSISSGAAGKLIDIFSGIWNRINGSVYDSSANAHILYFTSLPRLISQYPIGKILFGLGEGCSGFVMVIFRGQYSNLGNWALESDVMNTFWNKGIIGFVLFYAWLFSIAIRGYRIDKRYTYFMIPVLLCGITYNLQNDWLIVLEIVLSVAIAKNVNIFEFRRIKFSW